jgi:hypothetical protein
MTLIDGEFETGPIYRTKIRNKAVHTVLAVQMFAFQAAN